MFSSNKPPDPRGQGLVEYALVLTLVAIVVIAILTLLGPTIANVFSRINVGLGASGAGGSGGSIVAITRSDYDSARQEMHLDATVNGGHDPGITLTASPGGVMEGHSHHDHYHLEYNLAGCPCTVTVTSSAGGSASVTVGP
jgi:pilus assembly protein Flp/PilA